MLQPQSRQERHIFFPWEGRGGLRRFLARGRFGPILVLFAFVSFVTLVVARERQASGERRTRVALNVVRPAVDRYLLDQDGACPGSLADVLVYLRVPELPRDAWGQPLRLVCPSGRAGIDYVLMSDGPDGEAGGLDRIEY